MNSFQSFKVWYEFSFALHSSFHYSLEYLVNLTSLECLYQRESDKDIYSCTIFSSDFILEILDVLSIISLRTLENFTSSLLFLIIVLCLSWINLSLMIILTVRIAWSEKLWKLGKIEYLSISRELAYKNIRSTTELESLGLLAYWVGTWIIEVDNLRLKEFAIFMSKLI